MRLSYLITVAFAAILASAKPDKGKGRAKDKGKGRADDPGPSNSGQSNSNELYIPLAREDLERILLTNEYRDSSSSNAGRSGRASSSRHGGQDDGEGKDARRGRKRKEKAKGLPRDPSERRWEFANSRNQVPGDHEWTDNSYHVTEHPNRPGLTVWERGEGDGINRTVSMHRSMGHYTYTQTIEQENTELFQVVEDSVAAVRRDLDRSSAEIEAIRLEAFSRAGSHDSAAFSESGEFTPGATSAIYAGSLSRSSSLSPRSRNLTAPPPPELEYPDQEAWSEEYPEQGTWAEEYPEQGTWAEEYSEQGTWAEEYPEQEDQGDPPAEYAANPYPFVGLGDDGWQYDYDEVQGIYYRHDGRGHYQDLQGPDPSATLSLGPAPSTPTSTSMHHSLVSDGRDPNLRLATPTPVSSQLSHATLTLRLGAPAQSILNPSSTATLTLTLPAAAAPTAVAEATTLPFSAPASGAYAEREERVSVSALAAGGDYRRWLVLGAGGSPL